LKKHESVPPGAVARYSLLGVTVLGTIANNVINVPLHAIATDFDRSIATAVLSVSAFVIVLAVTMPVTGWVGDRWGQRRTLVVALILMVVGQLAAAMAPTLEFLIAARAIQGLACSAIPPLVMSMLIIFYPTQRLRMMGAWAAANGIGQAMGPPVGGVISDLAGWRSIFVMMAVASLVVLIGILWSVPSLPSRNTRLHFSGALMLVNGAALFLAALTALSLPHVPARVSVLAAVLGVALLGGFVLVSRNNPDAMIPPRLIIEPRFLRSCLAAFAQMFMLGTILVVTPLYFTGPLALSSSQAGMLFILLPLAMVLMAPMASRLSDRSSPRLVLRIGMLVIIGGGLFTGFVAEVWSKQDALWVISGMLLVLGAGIALVQTPAAAGATRSPAGSRGAALGLFNMLRFSGSAAGTAWVALTYPFGSMLFVFVGAALVAALGLMMSFVGTDPASVSEVGGRS
jgi:MFS family permease